MKPPITIHCKVAAGNKVIPDEGFEGAFMRDGPYSGECQFRYIPERGTRPALIEAFVSEDASPVPPVVGEEPGVLRYIVEEWTGTLLGSIFLRWKRRSDGGDVHYYDSHWVTTPAWPVPDPDDRILRTLWPRLGYPVPANYGSADGRNPAADPAALGDLYVDAGVTFTPAGDFTTDSFYVALADVLNGLTGISGDGTPLAAGECIRVEQLNIVAAGGWTSDTTLFLDDGADWTETETEWSGVWYDNGLGVIYDAYYVWKTRPAKGKKYRKL